MLDALVDRQDRQVAGAAEPAVVEDPLQVDQHARLAVGDPPDAVDVLGTGKVQLIAADAAAGVLEQAGGLVAEQLDDPVDGARFGRGNGHLTLLLDPLPAGQSMA